MQPFTRLEGVAAPLPRENVDTDVIIPSRDITSPGREGLGARAFAPWRFDAAGAERADFVLNRAPWRGAPVLLAGANFGCGSSREMAVWALQQIGLRCVVAPSFGAIFRDNCVKNGLLPLTLPADAVHALMAAACDERAPLVLQVDLQAQTVGAPGRPALRFEFDAQEREMLLAGADAVALTLRHAEAIAAFQAADRQRRPWAWP